MSAVARLTMLIRHHGLLFVAANVFVEQIGLPIPAIPTLILAGALTMRQFTVTHLLLTSVVSSVLADSVWYLLGRFKGDRLLRLLCRISLSPDSCVRRTEDFFERWGSASLLFAKFVPGLSTVAPPLAGASGVGFVPFLLLDATGAALWSGSAILVGRTFHRALDRVLGAIEQLGNWSLLIAAILLALFIAVKWIERRRFYRHLRVSRIAPAELMELRTRGVPHVVADVRTESARRRDGHAIPGSTTIDPDAIESSITSLPFDQEVILYCT